MHVRTAAALFSLFTTILPAALRAENAPYSIVARISAEAASAWDYATIDSATGKLYLAQSGVATLDLKSRTLTTGLIHAGITHGIAVLGDGRLAVDDSKTKEILIFDGEGKILSSIPTAADNPVDGIHALDALVLEPHSGLLAAVNGESGLLLLVDVTQSRVTATVELGGPAEFAAADGAGRLFVNVNHRRRSEIVSIDVESRRVIGRYSLPGCEGATGLAYDIAAHLIMSVCDNGRFMVIDAIQGRRVATISVGAGADAVMWDAKRRVAFVASGDSGTLSVIRVAGSSQIALMQVLPTQKGTRLGAVDPQTGILYLPTARFGPPKPPIPYPSVVPGSFEFLVVAPHG